MSKWHSHCFKGHCAFNRKPASSCLLKIMKNKNVFICLELLKILVPLFRTSSQSSISIPQSSSLRENLTNRDEAALQHNTGGKLIRTEPNPRQHLEISNLFILENVVTRTFPKSNLFVRSALRSATTTDLLETLTFKSKSS
jgi:hypothetical protein